MKVEDRIMPLNMLRRVAVSHFPGERGNDCPPCDLRERNLSRHHLPVRGWGSARTSPEERGLTVLSSLLFQVRRRRLLHLRLARRRGHHTC
jgi:hypothetical protein